MTTSQPMERRDSYRDANWWQIVWTAPGWLLGQLLILLVKLYQWTLSPLLTLLFGSACRFCPSCSQYFILAVRKHGPIVGAWKGIGRVCRCHPWHPGGVDWP